MSILDATGSRPSGGAGAAASDAGLLEYRQNSAGIFTVDPTSKLVDNTTGATVLNLAVGRWRIKANQEVYFLQGDNTIVAGDVSVDEATPDTSHAIYGGETVEFDVTDTTNNSIALKTNAGTALVLVSQKSSV